MAEIIQIVLLLLILCAVCLVPLVIALRLLAKVRAEVSNLISRLDQNLAVSVKLLELRNYYEQTAAELKKMLDESYREGNRLRQDQIRRLIERLDALRVRTLDRTVRLLEPAEQQGPHRRRRRGRRFRRPPGGPPQAPPSQNATRPPPGTQPRPAPEQPSS